MPPKHVIVAGGGLAGLSAACELVERGVRVTLVEKRPFVGGRTYSFTDPKSGHEADNGQHVFLHCCTEFIGLLKRIGSWEQAHLQDRLAVRFIDPERGLEVVLGEHRFLSLLRFKHLSVGDRWRIVRAFLTLAFMSESKREGLDGMSMQQWLQERGQSEVSMWRFWNVVVLATLNAPIDLVSAAQAIFVFREGFLKTREGMRVGYSRVGLSDLIGRPALAYLEARGAGIRMGRGITRITEAGVETGGETLSADAVISALPHHALWPLLPEEWRAQPFFAPIRELGTYPILNVHLWFDRDVLPFDFAAYYVKGMQWVFRREDGHLAIPISGAMEYLDRPRQEVIDEVLAAVRRAVPRAREATLNHAVMTTERHATFAAAPGAQRLRRPARTPIATFFLAGDWTDVKWPSTMEGAVRSGRIAAEAFLDA